MSLTLFMPTYPLPPLAPDNADESVSRAVAEQREVLQQPAISLAKKSA